MAFLECGEIRAGRRVFLTNSIVIELERNTQAQVTREASVAFSEQSVLDISQPAMLPRMTQLWYSERLVHGFKQSSIGNCEISEIGRNSMMMKFGLLRAGKFTLAAGAALMAATGCTTTTTHQLPAFPPEIHGWTPAEPDQTFTIDTLYDYIDGSAEVYRALNVHKVYARRYGKEGAPEIIADIFDMGTSYDAYGAYHHDIREGESTGIGQESELHGSSLSFWKDRYFVCIIPFDDTPAMRKAVRAIAEAISASIPGEGALPPLAVSLPHEGLVATQIHYFHTHLALNTHYFVAKDNLFELDADTNGIFARYRGSDASAAPFALVLIRYPNDQRASDALASFQAVYMPDAGADGMVKTENGLWTAASVRGDLLIAVFDAPSKADIEGIVAQVEQRQNQRR
jgi:uncharacterized protein DUF6599